MICREGWYYLVLLALLLGGAMLREVNLLLMLAGMLVGPWLINWRMVGLTLRGLEARRKVPRSVGAGELLLGTVSLANTRRRLGSWAVLVEDQIERQALLPAGPPMRPQMLFTYLPAGESRTGVYRGRLAQRGRYRLGPLRISTRFPFGFFRKTLVVGQTDTLTVLPRLGRLKGQWLMRQQEAFAGTHRQRRRQGPIEGDFYGVRPWRPGDSRRWIHWRASARHGQLVVRQFEQPRNRDLALLVDLWQPERPGAEHLDSVELAVSFASTVAADVCRAGGSDLLVGVTGLDPAVAHGPAASGLLHDVLETLALAEAQAADRLPELLAAASRQVEPGTELLLITTRPVDLHDAERFAVVVGDLAQRVLLRRIRVIDTSSAELAEWFEVE